MAVARHLGATLDASVINVDIPDVWNALSRFLLDLPAKIREVEAASRSRGRALLNTVAADAARSSVPLTRQELKAQPALMGEAAAREGRYFDLCMVGWTQGSETARMTAEELARAVADAAPFLEQASAISIVTVTDEKLLPREDIGDRLAHGLAARGLKAKAESIHAGDNEIGAALQEHAIRINGGLLVMGGWGHSRLRDFVLGGATEGILSDLRLPVLMSH